MSDIIKYIKKIQLSDGSTYYIKDGNALPLTGGTLTGDLRIDNKLIAGEAYILSIEDVTETPTNVLVEDETDHSIKKRSLELLLGDIGGVSCTIDAADGVLTLKTGK